ncbi:MAG: putative lipopolysaccharide heptosyltransferase III [Methylococcaceae bacterium]|nr:putative lipopolysaccharide heptosyltransferase III [Methylococcaceae bacterium]
MQSTHALSLKPQKILVIALRYLGDVLLTTPLLHALRLAYPAAQVHVLVYAETAAILAGNPDINQIITTPNRPKRADYQQLLPKLFRQYDLALATQSGDRPFWYSLLAAPRRIAAVPPKKSTGWWKRGFMHAWVEFDDEQTHTVLQHLKLLDSLGIDYAYDLVAPQLEAAEQLTLRQRYPALIAPTRYAVLHPYPRWTYKHWTLENWIAIGNYLSKAGLTVVLSGGAGQDEQAYVAAIADKLPQPTLNLAGAVSLAELTAVIASASVFIGPDTGVTHLAAATGVPVIALYGPTNPVKWAPWPKNYRQNSNPFQRVGSQQVHNIYLCQGQVAAGCVPCHLEGCDRHGESRSECLDKLAYVQLTPLIDQILNAP